MTVPVLAGVAVWFVVAWPVALVLGRVLAARNRQHPTPDHRRHLNMPNPSYVTSSYCYEGGCVGVAATPDGHFLVTNTSTNNSAPVSFTTEEWDTFIAGVKNGEFDPERLRSQLA